VSAIAVAPGNSQRVMAGTTEGDVYRTAAALNADSNSIWTANRPRAGFVSSLAFEPGSQDVVYATYAGFGGAHVWRSDDFGESWQALDGSGSSGLPDIPVHSVVIDPENPNRLYLGTDLGVFTSRDRGHSWAVENTGFANAVTEWLALETDDHGDPWLFAFTHGRGAYRVPLNASSPSPRRPDARRGR
jgi:hypothetical protein